MKIKLHEILDSIGKSLTIAELFSLSEFELQGREIKFPDKAMINATVTNTQDAILLDVLIEGVAVLNCTRCLEDFKWPFKIEFSESYDKKGGDKIDLRQVLDISSEIYQHLVLNIPMQIVCKPECQGICSKCGINKNEKSCNCYRVSADPRWEKLQLLLGK